MKLVKCRKGWFHLLVKDSLRQFSIIHWFFLHELIFKLIAALSKEFRISTNILTISWVLEAATQPLDGPSNDGLDKMTFRNSVKPKFVVFPSLISTGTWQLKLPCKQTRDRDKYLLDQVLKTTHTYSRTHFTRSQK